MKIIIAGAGEVGTHLAKLLSSETNETTVIDPDQGRLSALSENTDVITVQGHSASIETLKEAKVGSADLFIAVNPSNSQNVNVVSALLAKKLGCRKVTARVNNEEYLQYDNRVIFTEMGIDMLFYPEKIASGEIVELLRRTQTTESLDFARGKLQLAVFKLEEDSPLIDLRLIELGQQLSKIRQEFRVVAIARNNETIIPKPDTKFKYNDLVYFIAKRDGIEVLSEYMGTSEVKIDKVMILGGGPIGEMVAKQISHMVSTVKIIESDKNRCFQLADKFDSNVLVINGDGRNTDLLLEENIRDFDAFVAVSENSEENILACVAAKKLGVSRTIAEVENIEYIHLAEGMGVDATINKKLITASRIFKLTLSNKVKLIRYMTGTDAQVLEFVVAPDTRITKKPLKDLNFPSGAVIGGAIRGTDALIAVGDTTFEPYDRVIVFAAPGAVKEVDRFFR